MRLRVKHQTSYRYEKPVSYTIQSLRLSPRPHDGLIVLNWRVQADGQRDLPSFIDGFGNLVHCYSVNRRHESVTLMVEGEVETIDTAGIVRGGPEPLPPAFYLRLTPLTMSNPDMRSLAEQVRRCSTTLDGGIDVAGIDHEEPRFAAELLVIAPRQADPLHT